MLIALQKPVEILIAVAGGAGMVLFALLSILVRKKGREIMRVGFDWGTNTMWVFRGGKIHYLPNANCITTLDLKKETYGSGPGAVAIGEDVIPTGGGVTATWVLTAEYSSGTWGSKGVN